jgi:hypothetical protein
MTNGVKFMIQKKSSTFFLKRDYWSNLGRPIGRGCTGIWTTYYDTLSEAKIDFDKFVEHDSKLTEWTEVNL